MVCKAQPPSNHATSQVFGTAPDHAATSKLPQHGFARNNKWEFMGKSTTESSATGDDTGGDTNVKLDFGLSSSSLDDETKALWPYEFDLIYSVTLEKNSLNTAMVITNKDAKAFEFELLMHTYLRVKVRCPIRPCWNHPMMLGGMHSL